MNRPEDVRLLCPDCGAMSPPFTPHDCPRSRGRRNPVPVEELLARAERCLGYLLAPDGHTFDASDNESCHCGCHRCTLLRDLRARERPVRAPISETDRHELAWTVQAATELLRAYDARGEQMAEMREVMRRVVEMLEEASRS